jgi:hypothetical protein
MKQDFVIKQRQEGITGRRIHQERQLKLTLAPPVEWLVSFISIGNVK